MLVLDGSESDRHMFTHPRAAAILLNDLEIERQELHQMLLFYDVTEMATAVKPSLLKLLLDRGEEAVCYLDPAILVYNPFDELVARAEQDGIVLVPHALTPFPRDGLLPAEQSILRSGVFNLGFVAVGQTGRAFLDWWHRRLATDALDATEIGLFTDQRWVDFVPSLFPHAICRDPGMNVAYWNVHERGVILTDRGPATQDGHAIRFFHFSGFDPAMPHRLSRHGFDRPRVMLENEPALATLCREYAAALMGADYAKWSCIPYGFDTLPGGLRLSQKIRRQYRSAIVEGEDSEVPRDPLADGGVAFRRWLFAPVGGSNRPPMRRVDLGYWRDDPLAQRLFPDPAGYDA